jgi:hypothetical protein
MPSNVNSILALIFCFSGFTDAIAVSSNSSEATGRIAEARDSWLAAFKSKDVGAANREFEFHPLRHLRFEFRLAIGDLQQQEVRYDKRA